MDDEIALRKRAREAMAAGTLPHRRPDRMWGGPGAGTTCAVCGDVITREDMGFELEFAPATVASTNPHLHIRCFAAWELERDSRSVNRDARAKVPGDLAGEVPLASETARIDVRALRAAAAGGTMTHREPDRNEPGVTK